MSYFSQEPLSALTKKNSFQLTQNVSSSQLKVADAIYANSVLQCAGKCLHSEFHAGSCNAFHLEDQSCKMLVLTERRERTVSDEDWPSGVYVSREAREDLPLYCNGGNPDQMIIVA